MVKGKKLCATDKKIIAKVIYWIFSANCHYCTEGVGE